MGKIEHSGFSEGARFHLPPSVQRALADDDIVAAQGYFEGERATYTELGEVIANPERE